MLEARYKIGKEIVGPRPLDEIRRDIKLGALAPDTPVQLTIDGLWTTIDGVDRKLDRFKKPSALRSPAVVFISGNLLLAGGGYFAPRLCLLAAGGAYLIAIVARYFEEGRRQPEWAAARFLTLLFPFAGLHVVGGEPSSPTVRWLFVSAFLQFATFCVLVYLGRGNW